MRVLNLFFKHSGILLFLLAMASACGLLQTSNDNEQEKDSKSNEDQPVHVNSPQFSGRTIPKTAQELNKVCSEVVKEYESKDIRKVKLEPKDIAPNEIELRFLAIHNSVRSRYGLKNLVWDKNIASYAQEWANFLRDNYNCKSQHRTWLNRRDGKKYGENLAYIEFKPSFAHGYFAGSPEWATLGWSDECKDYTYANNQCAPGEKCGHFTQVVWKDTQKLGCGVAVCRDALEQKEIWVCNYDPSGNITMITNGAENKLRPF
ncbi:MAG: hypothetical protein KC505_06620 [Myxococcales bacterium]|nr:hypothetical protein [Myxococcales bacterium]USN50742.1 MAG: hypothetical protein H6731_10875 [Myxococcales bacterium]